MEAWKFVNYSNISPLFALGFTTERWGLKPFPGNLVAIPGYFNEETEEASALPYSCPDNSSSFSSEYSAAYYYTYYYANGDWNDEEPSVVNITNSTICQHPQTCSDSGCVILVEGIGNTTTGPAKSHTIGLVYGISSLLVLISTIAIIMGCCCSAFPEEDRQHQMRDYSPSGRLDRFSPADLPQYNPPFAPSMPRLRKVVPKFAEQQAITTNKASEVVICADLLREMYGLDLVIWGKKHAVEAELPERERMKVRANAIYAEIRRLVYGWRAIPREMRGTEEWACIESISRVVERHGEKRYKV